MALGIIYGDIGTSPLYVLSSIIGKREITQELVYGGISCVFWTLTLQTTFKYILLTLQADNRGEGGIFSLFALVRRYRRWLYVPAIIGAGTLLADGIITPPISVASAIEGLRLIAVTWAIRIRSKKFSDRIFEFLMSSGKISRSAANCAILPSALASVFTRSIPVSIENSNPAMR